ncbi:MAG: ABC transporter ATP-binding protein [Proteobacteria bacterium]|nr:ABC transporter ATP-binding protein [Pseudomonadota bacterium]MDA1057437.1 ABC transporter ATP-binding protein [Pseudomonadota bacterium]
MAEKVSVDLGARAVLRCASLTAATGNFVGLIGPNGSGKTTLLRTMAGLQRRVAGTVRIDGQLINDMARAELARRLSFLPQGSEVHWPLRVERLVALGRIPHLDGWRRLSGPDHEAVAEALRAVGAAHLVERTVSALSTGERARVLLARALASEPAILLADEPVASLDLSHQLLVLDLIRDLCVQGMTAVVVFHDLTMAARYCDRLTLLVQGRTFAEGTPDEVLVPANLRDAYDVEGALRSDLGVPHVVSLRRIDRAPAGPLQ